MTIQRTCFAAASFLSLLALTACNNSNSPDQVSAPADSQPAPQTDSHAGHNHAAGEHAQPPAAENPAPQTDAANSPRLFAVDFSFEIPEGWSQQPASNAMRLTELVAPANQPDANPLVAAFSLAGGDIELNINRWKGQFAQDEPISSRDTLHLAGATIHLIEMVGGYRGMGGGEAAEGTLMRAAIIERPGQRNLFIKMTGPAETMEPLADAWAKMIQSITSP